MGFAGRTVKDNFHAVVEGQFYRSAQLSSERLRTVVQENGIRSIINLRVVNGKKSWFDEELAIVDEFDISHFNVGMYQSSPRVDKIQKLSAVLGSAEQPVLFHCAKGIDRTGLASVIVLLKQGQQDLKEIEKQVSWRYGAFTEDSMGRVFLAQYRQWLSDMGRQHNADEFERWLENGYVDPTGNVHFLVHNIHGQPWLRPFGRYNDGVKFEVNRTTTDTLVMTGWAFDTGNGSLLANMSVQLGDIPLKNIHYGIASPWLLDEFGREEWVNSGWALRHPLDELPFGCSDLFLTFNRLDGTRWKSPPAARICIRANSDQRR